MVTQIYVVGHDRYAIFNLKVLSKTGFERNG